MSRETWRHQSAHRSACEALRHCRGTVAQLAAQNRELRRELALARRLGEALLEALLRQDPDAALPLADRPADVTAGRDLDRRAEDSPPTTPITRRT